MYARRSDQRSSPEFWSSNFRSRASLQEAGSLLRLKMGRDPRWRAMSGHLRPGARVLDVGCGLGSWALFLASRGFDVAATDFSKELVGRAKRRVRLPWSVSRAEALPFAPDTFEALISWGLIEHYEAGPAEVLREFRRVLGPGGLLVVTVPLDGMRQRHAIEVVAAGRPQSEFYEYYFTPDELAEHLRSTGFEDVIARPIGKAPHVAAPHVYLRLVDRHPLVRDVGIQLLKPAMWASDSFHMLLGMGVKES